MFCKLDNDINKFKEKKNNIDLNRLKNVYKKIIKKANENLKTNNFVVNENNDKFLYLYGNDSSSLKVLSSSDEEINEFIQDDIFINNYNRNYFFNNKTIFSSQKRIDDNIEADIDENLLDNLKKYISIISSNNYFKNTKTTFLKVLKDFVEFKNKNSNIFSGGTDSSLTWAKKESVRKKSILNSYESYICNIFKEESTLDESKEFIKRLLSFIFSKRYNLLDENRLKEVTFNNVQEDSLYKVNVEAVNYINILNKNSKKINQFLFSEKNIKKTKKYTLIRYKNINEELYKQNLRKPLEIYNFCNFPSNAQSTINFFTYLNKNGIDYFKDAHVSEIMSLLNYAPNFYKSLYKSELELNIPNIEIKRIKKLSENINLQEEIEEDFYYKFDSKCLDRLWLCKSRSNKIGIGQFENLKIQYNKENGNPITTTISDEDTLYLPQEINEEIPLQSNNIDSVNVDFPEIDLFYSTITEKGTMLDLLSSTIINLFDSSSIFFPKKDSYQDIFDFFGKEENQEIIKIVFNIITIYSNIFSIYFDRLSTSSMYLLIKNLEKESNDEKCTLDSTREVLSREEIDKRYKDIENYYNYLISEDENNFLNLDRINNSFDIIDNRVRIEDKNSSINTINRIYNKCVIHDYMKSFSYDVLLNYYDHLRNINSVIQNNLENKNLDKIEKYYSEISINSEDTFRTRSESIYYLNNVSKKIQNSFYEKKLFKNYFIEGNIDLDEKYKSRLYFINKKKSKENEYNLLKTTYNKINNIFSYNDDSLGFLKNKKYDFIKIGISFNFLKNIDINNVIKFTVYKLNHSETRAKVSDYYYTPSLTSIPSCYYDSIKDIESPMLGYFNVKNKMSERFEIISLETFLEIDFIRNTYQGNLDSSSTINNYPVFESYRNVVEEAPSLFEMPYNIYSSMYFSSFCEYYEKLINNYNEKFNFLNENIDDRIVNTDFINTVTNINSEDFKEVFNEKIDNFNYPTYNKFSKTKTFSFEIENNTKNHTFINQLSSNQTNIDIYKNIACNKIYDYFNIMIESEENDNSSYIIEANII